MPGVVAGWSKSQFNSIAEQLNNGTRYFDLRLCGGASVDSIYTCHALTGEKFTDVINAVKTFNLAHPKELVILDLNHWYNNDNNLPQMMSNVYNYTQNTLGGAIAERSSYNINTDLGTYWANNKAVIISSVDTQLNPMVWQSVNSPVITDCNDSTDICSYWPNSTDLNVQKDKLNTALNYLRTTPHNYLFVLQAQMTPDTQTIIDGLFKPDPGSLLSFTEAYKYNMTSYLANPELFNGLAGLIFIEDFTNGIDLTELMRKNM